MADPDDLTKCLPQCPECRRLVEAMQEEIDESPDHFFVGSLAGHASGGIEAPFEAQRRIRELEQRIEVLEKHLSINRRRP